MTDNGSVVPADLHAAWEAAYLDYISVAEPTQDHHLLAEHSARVALAWRRMAEVPGIGWCSLAAFVAASEAFEQQARVFTRAGAHGSAPTRSRGASENLQVLDHRHSLVAVDGDRARRR